MTPSLRVPFASELSHRIVLVSPPFGGGAGSDCNAALDLSAKGQDIRLLNIRSIKGSANHFQKTLDFCGRDLS